MWPVKYPYSERMVYSDDGPNALIRNETSKGPYDDKMLPRFEVWVMFDGYVDRLQAEKVAEKIAAKEIVVDEITGDMRKVIEWAWMNSDSPPEIHDTAARLLQQPSLAHGFAT